ncbi:hypothetical protein [Nocardia nepalensis]|uniref:hypothetical protein n=1 Tax=Nocardia nepalensis TaxID=3375448 RepID=UPI003B67AB23
MLRSALDICRPEPATAARLALIDGRVGLIWAGRRHTAISPSLVAIDLLADPETL